jgi:hypothetical protein
MKVGGKHESKKKCETRKNNSREVTMKYYCFVVLIRHDSAEIWGFWYGLKLGIGILILMPRPVFSSLQFLLSNTLLADTEDIEAEL